VLERRAADPDRPLQILSAGCSTGEEPYTIAMVVRDRRAERPATPSILGVDIDPVALRKAAQGCYSTWALRTTPPHMRQRWFRPGRNGAILDEEIRRSVQFVQGNLADEHLPVWQPGRYDAVFCRNVLMYLVPRTVRALLNRITRALAPGGYLFLGHAETLRALDEEVAGQFACHHSHGTFYYQRVEPVAPTIAVRALPVDLAATAIPVTRRLDRPSSTPDALLVWERAGELLWAEKYGEALRLVEDALPQPDRPYGEPAALYAALLFHHGHLDQAETACQQLLDVDGRNAAAHYLLGACREARADLPGSLQHYRTASSLDPGFAMPRLRMGVLARQRGDLDVAVAELRRALILLPYENTERLLLFAGGFARAALIELCRAELLASGGDPR
jgi:chemotaxis protein methyltransferase CheR